MIVAGIDPGTTESAYCCFDGKRVIDFGKIANDELLRMVRNNSFAGCAGIAIEIFQSFGMPVGREVFATCQFSGRLQEAFGCDPRWHELFRKEVVTHLCGSARAKDSNVRRALIDRFGGDAQIRKGGLLHGISKDVWSALAISVTCWDQNFAREVAA